MKKWMAFALVTVLLAVLVSSGVHAGGGKVRGGKGEGAVNQVQLMDPPPFQP